MVAREPLEALIDVAPVTLEPVTLTAEAVSVTEALPPERVRVPALTLEAVMEPEPEVRLREPAEAIEEPLAVSVTLPEPLALRERLPEVVATDPVTAIEPLLLAAVLSELVPAAETEPETLRLEPEDAVRAPEFIEPETDMAPPEVS